MILVLKTLEGGIDAEQREFGPENHEVELLGGKIVVHHGRRKPGNMVDQLVLRIGIELRPASAGAVLLHVAAVRPDEKVVEAHAAKSPSAVQRQVSIPHRSLASPRAARDQALGTSAATGSAIDFADKLDARGEQPLGERFRAGALGHVRVLVEELEVLAEVEDVEELLVLARPEQVRAEPRAAADHLPELGLRPHRA